MVEDLIVENKKGRTPLVTSSTWRKSPTSESTSSPALKSSHPSTEVSDMAMLSAGLQVGDSDADGDGDSDGNGHGDVRGDGTPLPAASSIRGPSLPLRNENHGNGNAVRSIQSKTHNRNSPAASSTGLMAAATTGNDSRMTASRESTANSAVDGTHRQSNGQLKNSPDDIDSELSDPDSNVHSPLAVRLFQHKDEIIVGAKANGGPKSSPLRVVSDNEDEAMADVQDEPPVSHYPKRKRTSVFADLSESKLEEAPGDGTRAAAGHAFKTKSSRQSLGSVKGVVLGQWRDSMVPDKDKRHAVIGFIDVRDRLRTRIQPYSLDNELVSSEYPLPPGPGGSWVTFERVIFSKHLVGLDHFQVKEYVRLRTDANEKSDDERRVAEKAAVKEAIRRVKENPLFDNPATQPAIAHGADLPEALANAGRFDAKRRRVSGGFATINSSSHASPNASTEPPEPSPTSATHHQLQPRPSAGLTMLGPLPGTRPTRILLGFWTGSSEADPKDRHAVYGILGQNDMFRVKLVRETRDGRFVGGNFPSGAGALWIQYEEVEFEPHLKPLSRAEIKEYCRVRQYQLDHGESPGERTAGETRAVQEAKGRVMSGYKHAHQSIAPSHTPMAIESEVNGQLAKAKAEAGPELRQSRRKESRVQDRTPRASLGEAEIRANGRALNESDLGSSDSRSSSRAQAEGLGRAHALARKEIARAEAAQGRADLHAWHRERAAVMAADAAASAAAAAAEAAAAAASPAPATNGRTRLHESEDVQRLNKVWARQESLRMKAGSEDAKIYDGIKYERKATGPFMGKLVSQGTIINIEGEDYVEYRVLTKPSFF